MVKVSITLPNKAQIAFESEEPEVIHKIVELALRDLPRDLLAASQPSNGGIEKREPGEKGTDPGLVTPPQTDLPINGPLPSKEPAKRPGATRHPPPHPKTEVPPSSTTPVHPNGGPEGMPSGPFTQGEHSFLEFCRSVNPIGDMRRVVVAIEGSRRFLGKDSLDATELGKAFDLAGWRHPSSFTQTLRNAARNKFRWLERIPGRAGRYSTTELGRSTTLGGVS